jgi:uncharacterized protein YjiS (DUF1127 family)
MAYAARPRIAEKAARGRNPARLWQLAAAILVLWTQRARQRRDLRALDDRLLEDVGLTRVQVRRECAKPFWHP